MKSNSLQLFSQQLHSWCVQRLEQKPGPFRQAESYPDLLGLKSVISPPVVLWINRESCLAGGVILLPQRNEQEIVNLGIETVRALGLSHFYSWDRYEISCWSVLNDQAEKIWDYDLPLEDSSPIKFRESFNLLLDHMEQSFFERQLQLPVVSDLYIANLVNLTFFDILPIMQKNLQISRSTTTSGSIPLIEIKNLLFRTLLIPPTLALCDKLPAGIMPDSIIASLNKALNGLPHSLRQTWPSQAPASLELPTECYSRLHHYYCRIQQLKPYLAATIVPALNRLLNELAVNLGGYPVQNRQTDLKHVVINPDSFDPAIPPFLEIGASGILAATALIRYFSSAKQPELEQQATSPFTLADQLSEHLLIGTLYDSQKPSAAEQKELNAFLRISWPNRKLTLTTKTPIWVWHLLHLCGMTEKRSQLDLMLPTDWLWSSYGAVILSTLSGKLGFSLISMVNPNQLHCRLQPATEELTTIVELAGGKNRLITADPVHSWRSRIILALNVPDEVNQLLDSGGLNIYQLDSIKTFSQAGLLNFLHSSLGKGLWKLLAPGRAVPKKDNLSVALAGSGVPLPRENALAALAALSRSSEQISTADIDQELAIWLGNPLPVLAAAKSNRSNRNRVITVVTEDQIEAVLQRCRAEEIPNFPNDYLYDTPLAARVNYSFSGQLEKIESFFDQVILEDRQQQRLVIDGVKQAEALLLASSCRSGPIELPQSAKSTAVIIDRYCSALRKLRRNFSRHAAELVPDEKISSVLDIIWDKLPLPSWTLVNNQ